MPRKVKITVEKAESEISESSDTNSKVSDALKNMPSIINSKFIEKPKKGKILAKNDFEEINSDSFFDMPI